MSVTVIPHVSQLLRFPDIKRMYEIQVRFASGVQPSKEEFEHIKKFQGYDKTGALIEIIEEAAKLLDRASNIIFIYEGDEPDFSDPELCKAIQIFKGRWGIKSEPTKKIQS